MSYIYLNNRSFGDKFMPGIKSIMGQFLLADDITYEDTHHNTDLIALQMNAQRIGVRVRRYSAYQGWPDEFTIRYDKPSSNMPTEFDKIIQGWGDWFFYGFSNQDETAVIHWLIGDLKAFRKYIFERAIDDWEGFLLTHKQQNKDKNHTEFLAIKRYEIPNFIRATSENWFGSVPQNWCI